MVRIIFQLEFIYVCIVRKDKLTVSIFSGEPKFIVGGARDLGDNRRKSLRSHITRQVRPDGQAEEPPGQPAEPQAAATRPRPLLGMAPQPTQPQQQPRCNGRTDSRAPSAELPHGAIDLASIFGPDANKGLV